MEIFVDILIVGTGAAGLYSALNLSEDLNILLITKDSADKCNTFLAQGGISVARGEKDFDLFVKDTLKAGKYKNSMKAVKTLVHESIVNINKVIDYGANFEKENGSLKYTKEAAHSINRIVHSTDETGKELFLTLLEAIRNRKNVKIMENTTLIDIITKNNICCGGIAIKGEKRINIYSKETILATGGVGGLFKNSTSRRNLTGDGIAIAVRNNIETADLEYVQFHPTGLYDINVNCEKFLISESLRGEGAKLLNVHGKRFVDELLPRDEVSKAVYEEEEKSGLPFVFLDISFKGKDYIINRFPGIYKKCLESGIDITKQKIPVTPVQHYHMGGIAVDLYSRTSMDHLFACGEVSCTGVHGSNRLASNSLLEALVFSRRASEYINKSIGGVISVGSEDMKRRADISDYCEINKSIVIDKFEKMGEGIRSELVNY
jgi:L-aspartate oxidase